MGASVVYIHHVRVDGIKKRHECLTCVRLTRAAQLVPGSGLAMTLEHGPACRVVSCLKGKHALCPNVP